MTALSWIFGTLVAAVISDEFLAWTPRLAKYLVGVSTRTLPADSRLRVREELLADIDDLPGKLSKLLSALDSFRGVYLIHHQRLLPHVPAYVPIIIRMIDVLFAFFSIVFYFPMLLVLAIFVWARTGFTRSIFVKKPIVGRNGQVVYVTNFSTQWFKKNMASQSAIDKNSIIDLLFAEYGLAQLPMLVNVLRGQLSVFGPKPNSVGLAHRMAAKIPGYMGRYKVKPGMFETHIAPIRDYESDLETTAEERLFRHESAVAESFIDNYSVRMYLRLFFLPFYILIRTHILNRRRHSK